MAELVVRLPEELKEEMEKFPGVEWEAVVRRLLKTQLEGLFELKEILAKSELTEKDVEELSDKIDESLAKKFRESLRK